MHNFPIVSIIGRPNVGKSSLFNRFIKSRVAVVDNKPGVTRDRLYRTLIWNQKTFTVVDTGGLTAHSTRGLEFYINEQVQQAVNESSLILFLVDVTTGITDEDTHIARILKKLVDNEMAEFDIAPTHALSSIKYGHFGQYMKAYAKAYPKSPIGTLEKALQKQLKKLIHQVCFNRLVMPRSYDSSNSDIFNKWLSDNI